MAVEDDVRKNTSDIQVLTINVTRVTTLIENNEKRHDEVLQAVSRLNERFADIGATKDVLSDLKSDVRTLRHDMNNLANGVNAITIVSEKLNEATSTIAAQGAKIEGLADRVSNIEKKEAGRDGRAAGIQGTVKTFWSVFSTPFWCVVSAVTVYILSGMYSVKGPLSGD